MTLAASVGTKISDASAAGDDMPASILLVDDRPENLLALEVILEPLGLNLVRASSGSEALRCLLATDFALILLDVQMPIMDGFETAAMIKERERSRTIPIIFVTAINKDERYVAKGYSAGAVDYITKPFDPDILVSKVSVFVELYEKNREIKRHLEMQKHAELREIELRQMEREREVEHRHNQEIAESEARLRQFKATLDATLDSVLIFEPGTLRYQYANSGALQLLGCTVDDLSSQTLLDALPDADAKVFLAASADLISGATAVHRFESVFRRCDLGNVPVDVSLQYIADVDADPTQPAGRFVSIVRDITERKQAQAALAAAYERERRIATVLQSSMVMAPAPDAFAGLHIESFYEPALDEALLGGDFFDVFDLPGDRVAMFVGDVSGKGLLAAAHIAEVKYALRAILHGTVDAGVAITHLNEMMCRNAPAYDPDAVSVTFVALSLMILDPLTGNATLVWAGSEPSIIMNADREIRTIETHAMPLGVDANAKYEALHMRIEPDDTLFIFTDGITEARSRGEFFGDDGIAEVLKKAPAKLGLRELGQRIIDASRAFSGGKLNDDTCLLIARRRAPAPAKPKGKAAK